MSERVSQGDGVAPGVALVEQYVEAYNAKDMGRLEQLLHPAFQFEHHNRGFKAGSRAEMLELIRTIEDVFPDRRISEVRRTRSVDNTVIAEVVWEGTARKSLPGVVGAGEAWRLELCSLFGFEGRQLTTYDDFG
jgi:hypothetical protein